MRSWGVCWPSLFVQSAAQAARAHCKITKLSARLQGCSRHSMAMKTNAQSDYRVGTSAPPWGARGA
eukprot:1993304-Pyramimonas_sp.AAC.1